MKIIDLKIRIADKEILKGINISLEQAKTMVIIGESGSGKTMLSKMIVGQVPKKAICKGKILFNETNLLELNDRAWSNFRGNQIAYIAQNPMSLFNPKQTIKSHAVELFKSNGLDTKKSISGLLTAFETFNLKNGESLLKKYPFQLSGGMLQRVMFAMMTELNPKLIIADEPTSALDQHNTQTVIDSLKLFKQSGINLIVITHNYDLVKQLADDILIIKEGVQMEYAKADDILNNPKAAYTKLLMKPKEYKRYGETN